MAETNNPIISVITTTSNLIEKEQADAFNLMISLLDLQTYPEIEHIIIDNSSTDGTVEMLKDYKNKGYLNFFSEKDTGKFNGFNKGIMRARGKYVTFISCDDFFHDITALYDVVNLLEANNADFSFSPAYCRHPEDFTFLFVPAMHNAFQVMPCARQAMVFKKTMMEKENYFDEKFKLMADFDFIIRIILKKYKGVYFNGNYTTYKLGEKAYGNQQKATEESKAVYFKNYKNLCPLNDEVLNQMVNYSNFPKILLEKLSTCYPIEDKKLFFEKCEQMHQLRVKTQKDN